LPIQSLTITTRQNELGGQTIQRASLPSNTHKAGWGVGVALFEELMASLIREINRRSPASSDAFTAAQRPLNRGLLKTGVRNSAPSPAMFRRLSGRRLRRRPKSMSAYCRRRRASSRTRSYDKPWLTTSSLASLGGMRKSLPAAAMWPPLWLIIALLRRKLIFSDRNSVWLEEHQMRTLALLTKIRVPVSEDTDAVLSARGSRHRSAMAARQAAREARMRQLAETSNYSLPLLANRQTQRLVRGADEDDFEADGVLLMEDADALPPKAFRVSRRSAGRGRAVATPAASGPAAGQLMAPSRREAAAMAAVTSRTDSARDAGGRRRRVWAGGFGFLPPSGDSSGEGDAFAARMVAKLAPDTLDDDLEPSRKRRAAPTATMTEVTDIESASQVTGPRRPSWGGGTGRSGASKQKRSTREASRFDGSAQF
uniref:Uncharacterized protein n=1 Tax=Macrostomum lignano TaxID=282301 RepID=A0A1I8FIG9_9PLAT